MGYRRDVLNRGHTNAARLNRTNGRLATRARPFDDDVHFLHAVLDGDTRRTDGGGSLACGAAPGAAGCIGFGWWEKEADYEATIWDLREAKSAGSVGTNVTGTSAIIGAVVPIPFIARVQGTACNRLAGQLRRFFVGDSSAAKGAAPSDDAR